MSDEAQSLPELQAELEKAQVVLEDAKDMEREASRRETLARNECNRLQKKFDEAVEALRNSAPSGTDWKDRKRLGKE